MPRRLSFEILDQEDFMEAVTAFAWLEAASTRQPSASEDLLAQTWLHYWGGQVGEVNWRPTETVPEDYYAF